MNHLSCASIASGRVAVGVAAGIKCRPYLESPLTRVLTFVQARSFVNCKVGTNMKMDNGSHRQKEKKFPQFFTNEGNTQKNTGYHEEIQSDEEESDEGDFFDDDEEIESDDEVKTQAVDYLGTLDRESLQVRSFVTYYDKASGVPKEITSYKVCDIPVGEKPKNFPQFMKPRRDSDTESWFGSVFTGEVERRYLDYLGKLDWEPFENHATHFPRKHRSKDEKWLIFEKWAAHVARNYPSHELTKMRFVEFKKSLAAIDACNSHGDGKVKLDEILKWDIEGCHLSSCDGDKEIEEIDSFEKKRWVGRDGKFYALGCDNKVYEVFISYDGWL